MKDALEKSESKKTIATTLASVANMQKDAGSQISSFGIGMGLAFLGQYLVTKKRGSPAARTIARILGTDVDAINRDFVLDKLKDKEYLKIIQEMVLDVIKNKSIDDFAETLGLSSGEAWEVYRQIKVLRNALIMQLRKRRNSVRYQIHSELATNNC